MVENDCKELVLVLNSSRAAAEAESNSYRHLFKVLASLDDYRIQHQFREDNSVANELASLAMRGVVTDMEDLYGVYTHVEADRQNRARFRINQSLKKLKMSKNS